MHDLRGAVDAQFLHQFGPVGLGSLHSDAENDGGLLSGLACGDQQENLSFAGGELVAGINLRLARVGCHAAGLVVCVPMPRARTGTERQRETSPVSWPRTTNLTVSARI